MADSNHQKGTMDISAQKAAYRSFSQLIKWGTIASVICAVLAAILAGMWYDPLPPL